MQRNLALSFYLSPQQAVEWLAERGYKTSYRAVSEMMRSGVIPSILKDDFSGKKNPRIVTTVAALELYLEEKWKTATSRVNTTTQTQAANVRKRQELVELAHVPSAWEQALHAPKTETYMETRAAEVRREAERKAQERAAKRAAKHAAVHVQ